MLPFTRHIRQVISHAYISAGVFGQSKLLFLKSDPGYRDKKLENEGVNIVVSNTIRWATTGMQKLCTITRILTYVNTRVNTSLSDFNVHGSLVMGYKRLRYT